jgi:4-hydroxy-4-methyl-2-oxoglutarate aldolase
MDRTAFYDQLRAFLVAHNPDVDPGLVTGDANLVPRDHAGRPDRHRAPLAAHVPHHGPHLRRVRRAGGGRRCRVTALPAETIARFRGLFDGLGCALLHDAAHAYVRPVPPALTLRTPGLRLAGPAFPVETHNDMLPVLQALDAAPPGSVIVARNTADESEALAGDIFVTAAAAQGIAGLVVDGAIRDIDGIQGLGVPVFSRTVNYVSAKTALVPARAVPEAVTLASVAVAPGDWIFGDSDGLLVVEARLVSAVMNAAIVLHEREESLKRALRAGERLSTVCGLREFLAGEAPLKAAI